MASKHWKSFVKKEKTLEIKEVPDFASLLSGETKNTNKSLEDAAEFNTNLKSLLEEQKQLEGKMAALTGKKEESNEDKKYNHEIKSIDQRKREELAEEKKRKKRKQRNKEWRVDTPTKSKKKQDFAHKGVTKKQKKESGFTLTLKAEKVKKEPKTTLPLTVSLKQSMLVKQLQEKSDKRKTFINDIEVGKSEISSKTGADKVIVNAKKKVHTISEQIGEKRKKLNDFQTVPNTKKGTKTLKQLSELKTNADKTVSGITKGVKTYKKVKKVSNSIDTGLQKFTTAMKSSGMSVDKNLSKGVEIVSKVNTSLNKADKLFNTANKYVDKTASVTNLLTKKLDSIEAVKTKSKGANNTLNLGFLQKRQAKKEEKQNFNVADKKLSVNLNTIKDVKKGIDTLKNIKNVKDSFSF